MNAVISHIADVQKVVVRETVLCSDHPLFDVRGVPIRINYRIQTKTDVCQATQRIAGDRDLAVWKCTAAGDESRIRAAIGVRIST